MKPLWAIGLSCAALDFHLFEDWDFATGQNIISTSSLPVGDERRFNDGTPKELASAMCRAWVDAPVQRPDC